MKNRKEILFLHKFKIYLKRNYENNFEMDIMAGFSTGDLSYVFWQSWLPVWKYFNFWHKMGNLLLFLRKFHFPGNSACAPEHLM